MEFPWECVEIIRCAPALLVKHTLDVGAGFADVYDSFTHKVVNRWFHRRTVLVGDAAHVFPPFGAQGIANGVRDALALSWRLSFMCKPEAYRPGNASPDALLNQFSVERRSGVDKASQITMDNGRLLLNKSRILAETLNLVSGLLAYVPSVTDYMENTLLRDVKGYKNVKDGFFLRDGDGNGGGKIAQVWLRTATGTMLLSDRLFSHAESLLTLLLLANEDAPVTSSEMGKLLDVIQACELADGLLARDTVVISREDHPHREGNTTCRLHWICTVSELEACEASVPPRYKPAAFWERFDRGTKYALVRPDFIVFSQATSLSQLRSQLAHVHTMIA